MAQRTIVTLTDDLDGGEADQTVSFGLDGTAYEIDLSDKNATAMREALSNYIGAASVARADREASAKRAVREHRASQGKRGTSGSGKGYTPAEVRAWAASEGITVNERGRINKEVIEKFEYDKGLDK